MSKIFENLLLERTLRDSQLVPTYQDVIIEHQHLNISQTFKWNRYTGCLFEIRKDFPFNYFLVLETYFKFTTFLLANITSTQHSI